MTKGAGFKTEILILKRLGSPKPGWINDEKDETLQKLLELKIIEKNNDSSSSPISIAQDPIKINHES